MVKKFLGYAWAHPVRRASTFPKRTEYGSLRKGTEEMPGK